MAHLIRPFINAGGFPSVQEMYRSTRHFLILLPTRSRRLVIQNALLMTSIYETHLHSTVCLMRWGSGTDTSLFSDSFGNLDEFNTFRFALPIRRQVGGYRFRTETLLSF